MNLIKINTPCGEVQGESLETYNVFRGIRYANAERFERPIQVKNWVGLYDATEFKTLCIQKWQFNDLKRSHYYEREFRENNNYTYDENSLFLNVYAPKKCEKAPVIICIHGGSFSTGTGIEKQFNGHTYCERGIVFVAINYRLNLFGFMASKEYGGNFGIYDQLCAIDWVIDNIASFGGDPDNITLMGQSAGAMSIQTIINSPLLKPNIKRAIMQSGGGNMPFVFSPRPMKSSIEAWHRIFEKYTIEQLKTFPAEELFRVYHKAGMYGAYYTFPVIDKELVVNERYNYSIPTIIGTVEKDMSPKVLRYAVNKYAKKLDAADTPCYVYLFKHSLPGDIIGTFHSCDLWYTMGGMGTNWRPFKDEDYRLMNELHDRFANFVKGGDPNIKGQQDWNTYKTKEDIFIIK